VKSTKQSFEAYVPVPGVAKPQLDVGATTFESWLEDELSLGTAARVYVYPLRGSVIVKTTPVMPIVEIHPDDALALPVPVINGGD
jgi:hypothetical protein